MYPALFRLSFGLLLLFAFSCESNVIEPAPLDFDTDEELIIYSKTIQPIFNQHCSGSGCHIGERTSGAEYTTYESAIHSVGDQYETFVIAPGKPEPENSPVIDKLISRDPRFGQQMPLDNPGSLTDEELQALITWIDQGARNIPENP